MFVLPLSNLRNKNIFQIAKGFCGEPAETSMTGFTSIVVKKEKQTQLLNKQQCVTESQNSAGMVLSLLLNFVTTTVLSQEQYVKL